MPGARGIAISRFRPFPAKAVDNMKWSTRQREYCYGDMPMEYTIHERSGIEIAEIVSNDAVVRSAQDMLDILVNVPSPIIAIKKDMLAEGFFDLKTGLAGEILQKFSNYRRKLAIVGDFSGYASKSLNDFMYECNSGKEILFVGTIEEAMVAFSG